MKPLTLPATRARPPRAVGVPHTHPGGGPLSRRHFLATAGTAAAAAAALSVPRFVYASAGGALPNPIPGGLDTPLGVFHVLLPNHPAFGSPDPAANDPSVITDFNGHVGLAYVTGMGTRIDKRTGQSQRAPFEVDLRFMKGEYVGTDGRRYNGAFALV